MRLTVDLIWDAGAELGEGPLWDVAEQRLYWIDCFGRTIHSCDAAGGDRRSWRVPEHVGSMGLRERGGAILSLRNGFHLFDFDTGQTTPLVDPASGAERIRMNDGKVDGQGRFVAGYMDDEERDPLGALFRIDEQHQVTELENNIICFNGPCWSVDGCTFYFADSFRRTIYAYDYDPETGAATGRRVFADFAALGLDGCPDGATVDEADHVWSVEVFRGRLVRLRPDGTLERTVGLPVTSTTSLTFGGAGLDVAFVTSMARPIGGVAPSEREAGGVFAISGLEVRGLPEPRFKG